MFTIKRVIVESVASGVVNKIQGRSFIRGFATTFVASASRFLYNHWMNGDVDGRPGTKADPESKGDNGVPVYDKVNRRWPNQVGNQMENDKTKFSYEGKELSRFLNAIPGINAIAVVHDNIQVRSDGWFFNGARSALNFPMMLPAYFFAYTAMKSGPNNYAYLVNDKGSREK